MTRTRSFMDIVAAALLLVLGGKRALVAAGSSTVSERGHSARLYTPSVTAPGDTSASPSPFHTESLTVTVRSSDRAGVTYPSPVESEEPEREPEREPEPEGHSGTPVSEPKRKVQSNGNVNEEGLEFSSPMASTYTFSIISQTQEKVSSSGITQSTSPYKELNSSRLSTQTTSEIYETTSRSSSQTTLLDSTEISPQTSTHVPSQSSAQTYSQIYSQTSPQNSPRVSHSSTQTSSLRSLQTSFQASSGVSSQTSFQTYFQTLSQTSLQTSYEASSQGSPLTSTRSFIWDAQSMNADSQDRMNETTSSVFDQLDTTSGYYNASDSRPSNTQFNMQSTDVTQPSLDTISQDTLNATMPLVSDDTMMATEIMQYSIVSEGRVVHSENITLPFVPHNISTEGSTSSTSQLMNENVVSSTDNMRFTAETPTDFLYTHDSSEANTINENTSHLTSTVVSPVIITAADDSLIKAPRSHFPFTVDTEEHGDTTTVLPRSHWTGTQRSESSKDNSSKTTASNMTMTPPDVPSTTAWPQTPLTTHTTVQKTQTPSSRSSTSQNLHPTWTTRAFSQSSSGRGLVTQRMETTTAMPGNTTGYKAPTTTAYRHTTPVRTTMDRTTMDHTTKRFNERVTMAVTTTTFRSISSKAPAKMFLGTFFSVKFSNSSFDLHEIQREILQLLHSSLSGIKGYSRSTLGKSKVEGVRISVVNTFLMSAEVTRANVLSSVQMYLRNCTRAISHCRSVLRLGLSYNDESLCAAQKTQCNPQRAECTDTNGLIVCQCHPGYFKQSADDMSCVGCGDGFKLENSTCVPCVFGFGGFNCEHAYKLVAVVVTPAGGCLLLILLIALIVTCCRKDKNDINKMIFKSGDFQMSSYTDFPKSSSVSMEWGRETLELQDNGSTKNLLQMTDIYYPAALRNPELERRGLCQLSGLPGSRHSCIYPAQWNPSFVSDDTRRRDYF
ncbi:protein HEG isoform X2 [Scleropages formosus]|uniref:protein HEG isoform X2 n=1 Tax=Scleropages formosus TaxID=113540 RepID=UPI0008790EC0|nr:protein HEG-like isoform X2 [Scleropages formosus]